MSISRRFFLRGIGGATLALPVLPSLLTPLEARAQAAENQKIYLHLFTEHGAVFGANMFPSATITDRMSYGGHEIRRAPLTAAVSDGLSQVSPVLTASSARLGAGLVQKMNVLRGLDIPFGIAHYRGATLGNYASNNGDNPIAAEVRNTQQRRTIDQVMAWSPEFYGSASGVSQRSITVAVPEPYADAHLSYGYSNPAAGTGTIAPIQGTLDSWAVFARLFPNVGAATPTRAPIVDRVLEQYRRLRDGNRRLSADDRQRLDDYMQRVHEIQRRLGTQLASCTDVARSPTRNTSLSSSPGFALDPSSHAEFYRLITDILVAALQCGRTRIAALGLVSGEHSFSDQVTGVSWHDSVAHPAQDGGTAQDRMVRAKRYFFEHVLLDLVGKMDAVTMGDGKTLLDKSLVVWAQEHGNLTHQTTSIPIVTFGGADGALRTGNYCDYRNTGRKLRLAGAGGEYANEFLGLVMNQFFGTVLQTMGVPRSRWQESDHDGYGYRPRADMALGDTNNNLSTSDAYPQSIWSNAGQMLPWLTP